MPVTNQKLESILQRVGQWPLVAQDELLDIVAEIEEQLGGSYRATPEELQAIDAAEASGVASEKEVAAAFRRFRG